MRSMGPRERIVIMGVALTAALAGCTLGQVPPSDRVCTLIACGPSLEIALVGDHVPTVFTAAVTAETGEFINIRCTDGNAEFDPPEASRWAPNCPAGGVALQDFTPQRFTVTVRWSEGETSQTLEPVYSQTWPNGTDCDPTCRSARVDVIIPEIPPYGDESAWLVHADEAFGFRIKYPGALGIELGPLVDGYRITYVGDRIQIRTTWRDPLVCQGECPVIESTETVTVAGREATRAQGYIGSVGGNIPQYFLLYLFRQGADFVSFELYAESRDAQPGDPGVIVPLRQEEIELFERMLATLEFTR